MYFNNAGREWMVVVVFEEREKVLKNQKKLIF